MARLVAAVGGVVEKSYKGLGVNQVALRAGVSKP